MLVSHRHRFIYTKTRKTASTSVESYFEPYCMAEGEWALSHNREQYVSASGIIGQRGMGPGYQWWNHMPAQAIRDQLDPAVWASYYKFCVVRNPFDRMISMFYFRRRGNRGGIDVDRQQSDAEQFEHWLKTTTLPSDKEAYTIDDKLCMDFIARYERLHADLERICGDLGLPWRPSQLQQFKAGARPPEATVRAMYSDAARAVVAQTYAFELETFGYRFED